MIHICIIYIQFCCYRLYRLVVNTRCYLLTTCFFFLNQNVYMSLKIYRQLTVPRGERFTRPHTPLEELLAVNGSWKGQIFSSVVQPFLRCPHSYSKPFVHAHAINLIKLNWLPKPSSYNHENRRETRWEKEGHQLERSKRGQWRYDHNTLCTYMK